MTPQDLARITADLGARGKFARKDPALLACARALLEEVERVTSMEELGGEFAMEVRRHLADVGIERTFVDDCAAAAAAEILRLRAEVERLSSSADARRAGPSSEAPASIGEAPRLGVGSPSAAPASPAEPGSTTTPARTGVVLHPPEDPPEVAIRKAREEP